MLNLLDFELFFSKLSHSVQQNRTSRRGSGTPFLSSEPKNSANTVLSPPNPLNPDPMQPTSPVKSQFQPPSFSAPNDSFLASKPQETSNSSSSVVNENLQKQMNEMEEFERKQQSKFLREIEEHKKQLEMQQIEHRKILDHQRNMAKEQLRVLQVSISILFCRQFKAFN